MSGRRTLPAAPARRGWCPGLARPMPTGDGLLARIHPPLGILSLAQVRAVAEAARAHGNGHVDVTGRTNLQIRGVRPETQDALAAVLTAAGLGDTRDDGGPQRLTLVSPLCGLAPAPIDGHAVAARIEALGRAVAPLPAKALVAVEAGGPCDLPGIEADIHVRARAPGRAAIGLATGAEPLWLGERPEAEIPEAVAALLAAFARTGARRMRDLTEPERAGIPQQAFADAGRRQPSHLPDQDRARRGSGLNLAILAVDAPFGRCTAAMLLRLADTAEEAGAAEIRLSPSRGFVLALAPARIDDARARLAADFVTAPDDPRRAVAACPGAPACASGSTPTLRDAARLAEVFRPFAARGLSAHVSGCAKGCAEPRRAALTLVARDGLYGAVPGGAPGDPPVEWLTIEAALERVRGGQTANLEDLFRTKP